MLRSLRFAAVLFVAVLAACGVGGQSPGPGTAASSSSAAATTMPTPTATSPAESALRNPTAYVEGAPYEPAIDSHDFNGPIDNPYFPLTPGTTYVVEGGTERNESEVTRDTKVILGVATVVVHDRVWDDGELIEDTFDWYAQDRWGNVWYFGEDTSELDGGQVVSKEGSWEAGVDGAQPGIVMLADPRMGDTYRQEFYAGHAEDLAKVVEIGGSRAVAAGGYDDVLVTEDWTPLEPDIVESKTYARGVGFIYEEFVRGGEGSIELVEIRTDG
jgi:hypothetical protein